MGKRKTAAEAWNAECVRAERALLKAVKRWNKAPEDATRKQLNALSNARDAAQRKVHELYRNLPYSLDDVAGEVAAQQWEEEMVAAGEVTPRKRKRITSDQVAEVVNRYLRKRHTLVVEYEPSLNHHAWEIQETVGYDIPDEHIPAHQEILGRIWVEPKTEEGEVVGWTMGYGLAKGELQLVNKFRLATEFRGAYRAVEKEFGGLDDEPVQKKSKKAGGKKGRKNSTHA